MRQPPIAFRRRLGRAALLLAAVALPAGETAAQQKPTPGQAAPPAASATPAPVGPQTGPEFRRAVTLGRQIYAIDGAAALASAALRKGGIDPQAGGIVGWVTEPAANGILVRFVRRGSQGPEAAYDVTVDAGGGAPALARRDGAPLTPDQAAQFAAAQLALGRLDQPCSKTYRPVAFRDPGTRNWRVYAPATATDPGVFMVGGHFRFLVSPDGGRILSGGRLPPPSCLAGERTAEGHPAVAFMVAEPVSAIPTEVHVFLSLRQGIPLIVLTPDGKRWLVGNGTIATVKE
ncbi:hypothetical protein [Inquilinus sp. Marseille-Q2685]|uniref:hypothetical protein n=1 Tax=Inquilinus sp. Marseille-Q2685 TaxID=2866581 RepID=UPI001CE4A536|nr:hypothetical protein [Inquilinus sp. Marseille-Q2685]